MIAPQKYKKSLGNTQFKIGINAKELFLASFIPSILNFVFKLEPFLSVMVFVLALMLIAAKNKYLEKNKVSHTLTKKSFIEVNRIKLD